MNRCIGKDIPIHISFQDTVTVCGVARIPEWVGGTLHFSAQCLHEKKRSSSGTFPSVQYCHTLSRNAHRFWTNPMTGPDPNRGSDPHAPPVATPMVTIRGKWRPSTDAKWVTKMALYKQDWAKPQQNKFVGLARTEDMGDVVVNLKSIVCICPCICGLCKCLGLALWILYYTTSLVKGTRLQHLVFKHSPKFFLFFHSYYLKILTFQQNYLFQRQ